MYRCNRMNENARTRYVVMVTGGSGTLGRHVVGLLQTRADHVTDIRVLDLQPFQNSPAYISCKPVREYIGDVCDEGLVREACAGVTSVIHLANSDDFSPVPDIKKSYRINVEGTRTLVKVCKETGVKNVIFCSSVAVVYGFKEVLNGTEENMKPPEQFYYSADGETLSLAEQIVLDNNDSTMKTICLRPVMPYGENDERFLGCRILTGYYFPDYQCPDIRDWAYIGNIAWSFICAENVLRLNSNKEAPGSALLIGDDTPTQTPPDISFLGSVMEECELQPIWVKVYRICVAVCMHILYIILSMLSLFGYRNYRIDIWRFQSTRKTMLVSHEAAKRIIGYRPIYTPDYAKRSTKQYIEWKKKTHSQFTPHRVQTFFTTLEPLKKINRTL